VPRNQCEQPIFSASDQRNNFDGGAVGEDKEAALLEKTLHDLIVRDVCHSVMKEATFDSVI
jgi:hypothetical protein